jgi:hypothetical protein
MPTISIFFGIVVQMYWSDHPPPHVHAYYQGFEAILAIETGEVIGGHLPPKVSALLKNWILSRQEALLDNWDRGRRKVPFEKVPGADVA